MPRPRKRRFVQNPPVVTGFLPNSVPPWGRCEVLLTLEGLEALRLSDFEGLDQEAAAAKMNVSRQTFGRILAEARRTVAEALVLGKTLHIDGGDFQLPPHPPGRHRRRGGNG